MYITFCYASPLARNVLESVRREDKKRKVEATWLRVIGSASRALWLPGDSDFGSSEVIRCLGSPSVQCNVRLDRAEMIVYTDKTFRLKEEIKRTIFSIVGKIVCRGRGQVRVGRIKVYKIIKKGINLRIDTAIRGESILHRLTDIMAEGQRMRNYKRHQ